MMQQSLCYFFGESFATFPASPSIAWTRLMVEGAVVVIEAHDRLSGLAGGHVRTYSAVIKNGVTGCVKDKVADAGRQGARSTCETQLWNGLEEHQLGAA